MKKILLLVIPSLLLALAVFLLIQYISNSRSQTGALQITSSPVSKVYLDNNYLGQTPLCKCDANDMVTTGNYTIRLVPKDSNFSEFQEKITISPSVLTVVDRKFGKGALSDGSIISLSPLSDKKKTELEVVSIPAESSVHLDNNSIGATPLLFKNPTESDHILKVKKDGYNEKTIRIRTPLGYRLSVIAYLGINPNAVTGQAPSQTQPSGAPSGGTRAPSPSTAVAKVLILDTPTGFLRVRASNSLDSAQITTVSPGDSFPLVDEQSGWYEIRLTDGTLGWVSTQYAQKQ